MWTSVTLGRMHTRAWECDAAHMPDDNELLGTLGLADHLQRNL